MDGFLHKAMLGSGNSSVSAGQLMHDTSVFYPVIVYKFFDICELKQLKNIEITGS